MAQITFLFMTLLVVNSPAVLAQKAPIATNLQSPKDVVNGFLKNVRSGLYPDRASDYMADTVLAHQLTAEKPTTVQRTPANYTEHVKSFMVLFGNFSLVVTEQLAEGDKVYVRWVQTGKHLAEIDGYAPTGLTLTEITSVVYRVEKGKIVEYWLQTDRLGFAQQLEQNKLRVFAK